MFLANLLPGIRDLRTPLAVGYIWLLTFWLWIPTHFKDVAPSTGVPGDLARLTHYSGRLGIAIALSFIAYIIGALSALFNALLTRIGSFASYYLKWPSRFTFYIFKERVEIRWFDFLRVAWVPSDPDVNSFARYAIVSAQYRRSGLYNLEVAAAQVGSRDSRTSLWQESYLAYLILEVYTQGNLLLGKQEALFAAYDRLVAEYEFRIGVPAPFITLIVTLAIRWTPLWLLGLLPILLLLKSGSERRMEAGDLLADSVRQKRLRIVLPPDLALSIAKAEGDQPAKAEPNQLD